MTLTDSTTGVSSPGRPLLAVVDFKPFVDGHNKRGVGLAILESFKTIGFVYLVNHGIPEDRIANMFDWSKKFFSLPMEVKQLAPHPESGTHHKGYSAPGREKIKHNKLDNTVGDTGSVTALGESPIPRDVKESFELGREDNAEMPNIWFPPDSNILPGFREACLDFFWTCDETAKLILRALAIGLDLSEDYFLPFHSLPDSQLRLLHYPSIPASGLKSEDATRIPKHTDFCTMTFLLQDEVGGLEVEDPEKPGSFIPVAPVPGSIVLNAADFLMRWSNDIIKSTSHRVRLPAGWGSDAAPDRYSIPFFCCADFSAEIDCIPGTWSSERPKQYPPISAKEYIMERLSINY